MSEIAKLGTAYVDVHGDFSKLDRGAKEAARRANRHFAGLGKLALGGLAAGGGTALAVFTKHAIGSASDINESLSKNRVLFGEHAKDIEKFSSNSAKAIGTSKAAVLEYTGTFGNLFRALGQTQGASAKYSTNLTKLAADMASFNNTSIEDALEAIRSGLVGETEPLRKFGVNMNDSTLKAEALVLAKKGLVSQSKATAKTLDPETKALAAQSLIAKQTAAAHGDFAKTSGGLANQQKILKAKLSDITAALGKQLLPAAKDVTKALADLSTDLSDIFERKDLSFSEKINKALATIRLDLSPLVSKFSGQLKSAQLGDKFAEVIQAVVPKLVDAMASSAPRAATAFINAFKNAGVWGRLLTVAFLASKLGAFSSLGKIVAARFAQAFAVDMAAESTLGKFEKAGKKPGRRFGKGFVLGMLLAIPLLLPDLIKELNKIRIHFGVHGIPPRPYLNFSYGDKAPPSKVGTYSGPTEKELQAPGAGDFDPAPKPLGPHKRHPIFGGGLPPHRPHRPGRGGAPHRPTAGDKQARRSSANWRSVHIENVNVTTPTSGAPDGRHLIAQLDQLAAAYG